MTKSSNPVTETIKCYYGSSSDDKKVLRQIADKQWVLLKGLLSRSKISLEVPPEESQNGELTSQHVESAIKHFLKIATIQGYEYGKKEKK